MLNRNKRVKKKRAKKNLYMHITAGQCIGTDAPYNRAMERKKLGREKRRRISEQ